MFQTDEEIYDLDSAPFQSPSDVDACLCFVLLLQMSKYLLNDQFVLVCNARRIIDGVQKSSSSSLFSSLTLTMSSSMASSSSTLGAK